jgi:translation elongation factor EF-4
LNCFTGCGPKGGGSVGDQLLSLECPIEGQDMGTAPVRHMVYAGIFPADQSQHTLLSDSIKKLALNDSAVSVIADSR